MIYTLSPVITVLGKVIVKPDKSFSFLSYLVRGDQNVLIDTVPVQAAAVFLQELEQCLPLEQLDALILNHAEEDHSGALEQLLERRPTLPIYCSPACQARLSARLPYARFHPVASGQRLSLGLHRFRFVHTPGLHWDDNMTTYLENEHTLFSNDLFGQSLGADIPLDTAFTPEAVVSGAQAYFEKVFTPATPEERAVVFGLADPDLACVAPGHGVVLRGCLDEVLCYYESVCG